MTALTGHARVRAGQREVAEVVIEIRIMPIRGVMTGSTIRTILAVVCVFLLVAGDTVHRRAPELSVHMAGLTSHVCVFAFQLKRRQVVIKLCRSPAIRSMTLAAIQPEPPLVRLVIMMTGVTILQCH